MRIEEKEQRSIYFWLKNLFSNVSNMNYTEEFPETDLVIPTVCIERRNVYLDRLELGNRHGVRLNFWVIDIFAPNKTQRNEFTWKILDNLEDNITVYDYDEGFPPSVTPSAIGVISPDEIRSTFIKVIPDLDEKLYWRAQITFISTLNKSEEEFN